MGISVCKLSSKVHNCGQAKKINDFHIVYTDKTSSSSMLLRKIFLYMENMQPVWPSIIRSALRNTLANQISRKPISKNKKCNHKI